MNQLRLISTGVQMELAAETRIIQQQCTPDLGAEILQTGEDDRHLQRGHQFVHSALMKKGAINEPPGRSAELASVPDLSTISLFAPHYR